MSRIDTILQEIENAPPFPKVAQRLMSLLNDPDVKVSELKQVIEYDEAIAANVLKICNAPIYGLVRKITSLDDALVVLGQDSLRDIIVTSSSSRYYKGNAGDGYSLEQGELWKHSVAVGIMAKYLAKSVKGVDPSTAYTVGLLHDIGKRFLGMYVAEDLRKIMLKVAKEGTTFVGAEEEVLGINHAAFGGLILKKWDFSEEMQNAVKKHHDPDVLDDDPLAAVVALANGIIISMGIGVGADGLATELRGIGLERFGIGETTLDKAMINLLDEMDKAQELLQI